MKLIKVIIAAFAVVACTFANAQTTFYDLSTVQNIEIQFSQPDWDYQMDTSRLGEDGYIMADWVRINGVQLDSVGVKYKGNSSYDSTYTKNPVHIEIDNLLNQSYQGVTDIKLSNCYADPSMIREVLAYDILKNYMHCPRSNFARLYINGNYIGLYSSDENINKEFCSNHFYSSQNAFFKCNPIVLPGPTTKSNLKYINSDSSSYFNFYELKSEEGWNELVALCDSVTNHGSTVDNIVDIDRVAWMLAFNSLLVNLDSYSGVFCQNYYIYKDNTGHFNPIVWDLNMAFGGFPYVGSGNSSMGSLSITNMQQLSPTFHSADPYWPLINAVMNNGMFKRMYIAHMRTIANEMFASNNYVTTAATLQALVDSSVQADNNKFYSYTQFQNAMNTDYSVGSYSVPGISNLMSARLAYLQSNLDYSATPPSISAVQPTTTSPALNSTIYITAMVTNTNAVYLGFRDDPAKKFTRVLMYDDGLHNDGAAGDNVYGADMFVSGAIMQYYIYAENNNAGMFAPERAEHEFYSVNPSLQQLNAGDVVINEFMATNQSTVTDLNGEYEDWIELHNNLNVAVSLYGTYLSDDQSNPQKWAFPQSASIPANGYIIVWVDEDASQVGLHANFKLAGSGEEILFTSASATIDSTTYLQQTTDVSSGRCINGSGPFQSMTPSFNAANICQVGVGELSYTKDFSVFPNPSKGVIHVVAHNTGITHIRIFDITSQVVDELIPTDGNTVINMSDHSPGVYFLKINNEIPVKVMLIN